MGWTHTLKELSAVIDAAPVSPGVAFHAVSTDTRTLIPGAVFFALKGERFDGNAFVGEAFAKGACAAVTTRPSDAGPCLVTPDPLAALQRFAAWHRQRFAPALIAITGSCGKTTSKDLVAAVLGSRHRIVKTRGNLNNEIGCPLSLLEIDDGTDAAVIEMGASHVGEIARLCRWAQPTEAAVTLVAPAHLEGFGSVRKVAQAKAEIVDALPSDGVFYVNMDDEWCVRMAESFPGVKVRYGTLGDVVLEGCERDPSGDMRLRVRPVGELRLPIPSRAHAWNVLLAIAVGLRHGVGTRHGVCESARYYEVPLRRACLESSRFKVLSAGGVEIIDDSYNANPASMAAALDALAERPARNRVAAFGDMLELGNEAPVYHRRLGEQAGKLGLGCVFARGTFAQHIVDAARAAGVSCAEVVQDHGRMAEALRAVVGPGDVVLVKGSRGMKMECVVEALMQLLV